MPLSQGAYKKPVGLKAVPSRVRRSVERLAPASGEPPQQNGALSNSIRRLLNLLDVSASQEVSDKRNNKQNEKDVEDDFRNSG
jgi:Asp-tRNA(Asn)/Glu-tRNA(Gln) amidotransferase A subunit family amidase